MFFCQNPEYTYKTFCNKSWELKPTSIYCRENKPVVKDLTGTTTVQNLSSGVYTASRVISRRNMCIHSFISLDLHRDLQIIGIKEQSLKPIKIPQMPAGAN